MLTRCLNQFRKEYYGLVAQELPRYVRNKHIYYFRNSLDRRIVTGVNSPGYLIGR